MWRDAPTYRLPRGGAIAIAERSRGLNREDANRLSLHRDLWLAFDHGGFDAVDQVTGTMQQGWRLDMLSPLRLLNARIDDETMLITDGADGRTGVEVRTPNLEVTALSRLEPNGALPATGWDARFENVAATLHLPPGHRLLAAWGVDDAPDAWLERWQLLDLFLLMLVTAAAYTLLGWGGAAAAGVAMLLTHHEVRRAELVLDQCIDCDRDRARRSRGTSAQMGGGLSHGVARGADPRVDAVRNRAIPARASSAIAGRNSPTTVRAGCGKRRETLRVDRRPA